MLKPGHAYGLYVICYDIASNRRRSRVVRELEAFGVRVQESVFECWIDEAQRRQLEQTIAKVIRTQQDSLVCYRTGADPGDILLIGSQLSVAPRHLLF